MSDSLGTALPAEMARVRDKVLPDYLADEALSAFEKRNEELGIRARLAEATAAGFEHEAKTAEALVTSLKAENERLTRALDVQVQTFGRQASPPLPVHPDDDEAERVMRLGDQIGYGNLMDLAARGWRHRLAEDGDPVGGEFAVGTSVALAQRAMTIARAVLMGAVPELFNGTAHLTPADRETSKDGEG